jgi:hypothetical protein
MTGARLNVIPYSWRRPAGVLVLPWWLTPDFCAKWLDELRRFRRAKRAGRFTGNLSAGAITEQMKRYEAIVVHRDWDKKRGWQVAWSQPKEQVLIPPRKLRDYPDWLQTLDGKWKVRLE